MSAISELRKVLDGDFCSGCGACAYASGSKMSLNEYGEYVPKLDEKSTNEHSADQVCPFLNPEMNEDILGEEFLESSGTLDPYIGKHIGTYAAYVKIDSIRKGGTSGGMGSWIALELLKRGLIDGVIHAKAVERNGETAPFFEYGISRTESEVKEGARTRYHVMQITEVMNEVRSTPGRYLFIGVPCFAKAVRRLQKFDPIIAERVKYVASLVCGHYKSVNWTLSLGWAAGVAPNDLAAFQYRTKGPDIPARAYVYRATSKEGSVVQKDSAEVVGGKFNAGAMMLNACDYCDDVVGETADITIGDAWLPKFDIHRGGTNLIITRNKDLEELVTSGSKDGDIYLEKITAKEARESQSGGYRQRREGLSYRLGKLKSKAVWAPEKRIAPDSIPLSRTRKKIYDLRSECTDSSKKEFVRALNEGDYQLYAKSVGEDFRKLRQIEVRSALFRVAIGRAKRLFIKIKGK